jgi:hypothetical protein
MKTEFSYLDHIDENGRSTIPYSSPMRVLCIQSRDGSAHYFKTADVRLGTGSRVLAVDNLETTTNRAEAARLFYDQAEQIINCIHREIETGKHAEHNILFCF